MTTRPLTTRGVFARPSVEREPLATDIDDDANWRYAMPMVKRFLSGRDFEAALDFFKQRGLSAAQLCKLLECADNQTRRWSRLGAPRYIALALAAIRWNRPPWRPTKAMVERLEKKERARAGERIIKAGSRNEEIFALRDTGLTLDEIGMRFKISKERVRQILDERYAMKSERTKK
jgi:hypothetical protein